MYRLVTQPLITRSIASLARVAEFSVRLYEPTNTALRHCPAYFASSTITLLWL